MAALSLSSNSVMVHRRLPGHRRTWRLPHSFRHAAGPALARPLFCYQHEGAWHPLHSREVGNYIAAVSGGHFTAKEFRTWNATVLMALVLASAGPAATAQARTRVIAASVREVARALGDTPAVARSSYIDPRLVSCYESEGGLPGIEPGARPAVLPAPAGAEAAVAALLAARGDGLVSG